MIEGQSFREMLGEQAILGILIPAGKLITLALPLQPIMRLVEHGRLAWIMISEVERTSVAFSLLPEKQPSG